MGSTPEAMIETFDIIDSKAGGLFVVEWATSLEFVPGLGQPGGARDYARE